MFEFGSLEIASSVFAFVLGVGLTMLILGKLDGKQAFQFLFYGILAWFLLGFITAPTATAERLKFIVTGILKGFGVETGW